MQSDSATQRRTTTFLNVAAGAAVTLGMIVLLLLLWYVRSLVLLTFLAVLFGVTLARGVDHLERWKLPRAAGAAAIVLVLIGAFWGLGVWLAPTISEQAKEIRRGLPAAVDKLEAWINRQPLVNVALGGRETVRSGGQQTAATPDAARANDVPSAEDGSANAGGRASVPQRSRASLSRRLNEQLGGVAKHLFPFLASAVSAVSGTLLLLFLSIYIAVNPRMYRDGILHLFPHGRRDRAASVLESVSVVLRQWMGAQLVSMLAIAVITTGVLLLLDVKAAIALGVLAGLSEFIPVFGPLISAVPALGIAFLDSPQKALYVLIAYVAIQQVESNILTPLVMKKGVDVPPVVTILAGSVMAILFGFLGLLVAVPLAAALMVVVKTTYVRPVIGDDVPVATVEPSGREEQGQRPNP